jgi:predicted RND superfamily exporter protein
MVKVKAAVLVVVVACVLVMLGVCGLSAIAAETEANYNFPPVIQKLVDKFNLDPAKVNDVLQEERKAADAKRESMVEQKLDQAVESGQITASQKEAILAKRVEMQAKFETLRNLAPPERCEAMQQLRDEMEKWAQDNGIDAKQLLMVAPGKHGFMRGAMGMKGGFCGPRFGGWGPPAAEQ